MILGKPRKPALPVPLFTVLCTQCGEITKHAPAPHAWAWMQNHETVTIMTDDQYAWMVNDMMAEAEYLIETHE
jgi:hypothetical protein